MVPKSGESHVKRASNEKSNIESFGKSTHFWRDRNAFKSAARSFSIGVLADTVYLASIIPARFHMCSSVVRGQVHPANRQRAGSAAMCSSIQFQEERNSKSSLLEIVSNLNPAARLPVACLSKEMALVGMAWVDTFS